MDEAIFVPEPPTRLDLILDKVIYSGPIAMLGWLSLLVVIVLGCILLMKPVRSDRRGSLVDLFAACLHIQTLIFILFVPLPLIGAAYLTLSNEPYVMDAFFAMGYVILNFAIGGALLVAMVLRHRKAPTIEWMPAVSVLWRSFRCLRCGSLSWRS